MIMLGQSAMEAEKEIFTPPARPCSWEYAGDMWQLLYAGAAGGREGVPETIQFHRLVWPRWRTATHGEDGS
jgi:hypothetical protein